MRHSWGRIHRFEHQLMPINWRSEPLDFAAISGPVLGYGSGRSYGDSCLNDRGTLLCTSGLNRLIAFDRSAGILRCEAGSTLADILSVIVPHGWFLPVTPGTQYVTVGGCIANDVHGKNHHRAGTFGCHVIQFELLSSDGTRRICSPTQNQELFRATIGGLGLTGLVLWAEIRLKKIANEVVDTETIPFDNLREFFALCHESDANFEYTVAWIDCFQEHHKLGRGVFFRGNHNEYLPNTSQRRPSTHLLRVPYDAPKGLLAPTVMRAFNALYYWIKTKTPRHDQTHFAPFFYPLDGLSDWNRLYGKQGFFQYQCVVPDDTGSEAIGAILNVISRAHAGSFLAVLKKFGEIPSAGLLSFPRKGVTLALDFPNCGAKTYALLETLDSIVRDTGGALYPAKDARMSPSSFEHFFPQWKTFAAFKDPMFSSSFWRRVTGEAR